MSGSVGVVTGREAAGVVGAAGALKVNVRGDEVPVAPLGDPHVVKCLSLVTPRVAVGDRGDGRGRGGVGALVVVATAVVHGDGGDGTERVNRRGDVVAAPAAAVERDRRRGHVPLTAGDDGDVTDGIRAVNLDHRAVEQRHRERIRQPRRFAAVPVNRQLGAGTDRARPAPGRVLARRRGRAKRGRHADNLGARDVTHAAANLADDVRHVILFVGSASVGGVYAAESALKVLGR